MLEVRDLKVHFPITKGADPRSASSAGCAPSTASTSTSRRQSTLGLVGESGCGKSTVGKAMLRLVAASPTAPCTFDGVGPRGARGRATCARRRRHMQMVFQDPFASLDPRQSVEHPHRAARDPRPPPATARRAGRRSCSTSVGLPAGAGRPLPARVLRRPAAAHRHRPGARRSSPSLIIADEPVSRARRLDPGAGGQPPRATCRSSSGSTYLVHLPRPRRRAPRRRRRRRDVPRRHRREGVRRRRCTTSRCTRTRWRCCRRSRSPIPIVEDDAEAHRARRATCRRRRTRRPAAGSTPAASTPTSAAPTRRPPLREVEPGHFVACHYAEDIAVGIHPTIEERAAAESMPVVTSD